MRFALVLLLALATAAATTEERASTRGSISQASALTREVSPSHERKPKQS